jgi:hypothetical protein
LLGHPEIWILTDPRRREGIERKDEVASTAEVLFLGSGAILDEAAGSIQVGQVQHGRIIPFVDEPLRNENTVIVLDTDLGLDRGNRINESVQRLTIHGSMGDNLISGRKVNLLSGLRDVPALAENGQRRVE